MDDVDAPTRTRTADPQPAAKAQRSFSLTVLIAVLWAGLAGGFGLGWASHTAGKNSSSGPTASGATVAVHGTLQLSHTAYDSAGTTCYGTGGYQDISGGVAVTIGDQAGKTLAVTSLEPGRFAGGGCALDFAAQVPAGATLYTVVISHRGTQTFPAAAVADGFNMTLGS